ncbi:MAG: Mrp/NBP35 family ATP-binding protein [Thermoplasmata archaeon]|nr:MAG: Mrp/NBP35 family ATP-binding protein [Thermoplasmata archaeon]KAA0011046.1 MAG: Mrp/NBP35 family ATP-binding protein [Thermoplasmata archaeon]
MEELNRKIKENLKNVKHKIAILSGKGGVGKTTVAVNLAYALAMKKYETGLLDADIHGPNVPKMLGIEHESVYGDEQGMEPIKAAPHLKVISLAFMLGKDMPVIWRGPLKMTAIKQFIGEVKWGNLDFLIIDLPPGTGDEPLSIAQLIRGDAIIVTTPQDVALLDSRRAVNFARQLGMKVLGIIENMSGFRCPHCGREINLFKVGGGETAAKEMEIDFLGRIPIDEKVVVSGDAGIPFVKEDNKTSRAFMAIVDNLLTSLV